jgi:hypothetical protein
MAKCDGEIVTTVKTDREMRNYIEHRAEELGVSKTEFVRRIFDTHRAIVEGPTKCPDCGAELEVDMHER